MCTPAGPVTDTEQALTDILADVLRLDRVCADSHFFDDLGADSMLMAHFCARVRKRPELPSVSMRDVYQHPTVASLVRAADTTSQKTDSVPTAGPADQSNAQAECERAFADVLAGIVGHAHLSVDDHFFDDLGADSMLMARFCARVRKLDELPTVSMPDVYLHPTIRSLATTFVGHLPTAGPAGDPTASGACERKLAEVLADIVGTEHLSVDDHFFDDLGADSMLMARFCARVRKRPDLPSVSMQDVYEHPTIRSLAAALGDSTPTPASRPAAPTGLIDPPRRASSGEYALCAAVQLLVLFGGPALSVAVGMKVFGWILASPNLGVVYLRSFGSGSAAFLALCTLPILLKWILVGRWKPQEIRVWSTAYLRFWLVKTLIQRNPMVLFTGSPLYSFYLRALGAKVGRRAVILSPVPVCTDLVSIGDRAVIRKNSVLTGYRACDGIIRTGPVHVGNDALVGESTVLDIGTSLGDGAQLGHSSSLHPGQTVPSGERWHGSPAQPSGTEQQRLPAMHPGSRRRILYTTAQVISLLGIGAPLGLVIAVLALRKVPPLVTLLDAGPAALTSWAFYRDTLILSAVLVFGAALVGLVAVGTVPRVLNLFLEPDKVYPLYGFHHWVQRTIARMTNRRLYMRLFGGTSYVVHYLRWLGYDLHDVRQTGSNFGEEVMHETPFLSAVGSGTMVADGLSMINADYSHTSFRLRRVAVGADNFLGNRIAYPPEGRTGDNCLLATKLMVPLEGHVREGVGLLGAPSFEIPRSVRRDTQLDVTDPDELRRSLWAKNVHNTVSMALFLLTQWIAGIATTLLFLAAIDLWGSLGVLAFALATVGTSFFTVGYNLLVERLLLRLQALTPQGCSIYDCAFWRHERFWKMSSVNYLNAFNGTPMKSVLWRLMGARIGRRVFDDGGFLTERTFTTIGDDCTLNAGSVIQCHSQEDGGFKSDHTVIGAGCTLGVNAFVHYGVTMGEGAVLATDSFLMKGEEVPPDALWSGNPAKEMRERPRHVPVPVGGIVPRS